MTDSPLWCQFADPHKDKPADEELEGAGSDYNTVKDKDDQAPLETLEIVGFTLRSLRLFLDWRTTDGSGKTSAASCCIVLARNCPCNGSQFWTGYAGGN